MTSTAAPGPPEELTLRPDDARALFAAVDAACARIAPTWPLDRMIAVNPFWGMVDEPMPEVAARLAALSGARLLMPRRWYQAAYAEGRLRDAELTAAITRLGATETVAELRALLAQADTPGPTRARVADVVDAERDLVHAQSWRSFVTHAVSQLCAAYFDDGQASWTPDREGGLYASWRRQACVDRAPELLMGARGLREAVADLPETAEALLPAALRALGVPPAEHETYLWSLLLDQNGWASWCAYLRWVARLDGRDDGAIVELLAIRVAWEWLLLRLGGEPLERRWRAAMMGWPHVDAAARAARRADWVLQAALEHAWRAPVIRVMPDGFSATRPVAVDAQLVFCIDVRSEVLRRAVEAESSRVQTLGFAGFFGVPMEYRPLGTSATRPQLPGLLAARVAVTDTLGDGADGAAAERRATALGDAAAWRGLSSGALSTFPFVEALGLTYLAKLLQETLGRGRVSDGDAVGWTSAQAAARRPRLVSTRDGAPLELAARVDLAEGMLRGMSLTRGFARLVLLVGHGSSSRNNPHAAGLDCGACQGQTGALNARVAAALLGDPEVRAGLAARGLVLPAETHFVAALHDTTTDEVHLHDVTQVPESHRAELEQLRATLARAGHRARVERAPRLGLSAAEVGSLGPEGSRARLERRARDWAQVRPEWGLADNAAFVIAPRERCRHLKLGGRAFLHEYRAEEDDGYRVLEGILTAPMLVTHWINLQYYASTVDPERYGSGNKVLHNVVGGHLGVFEGNGGDLRIGLPWQSVHDGTGWVHTPLRLSVFVDAPRAAIDEILARHAKVRALVEGGWVSLFQLDVSAPGVFGWWRGAWHREEAAPG